MLDFPNLSIAGSVAAAALCDTLLAEDVMMLLAQREARRRSASEGLAGRRGECPDGRRRPGAQAAAAVGT